MQILAPWIAATDDKDTAFLDDKVMLSDMADMAYAKDLWRNSAKDRQRVTHILKKLSKINPYTYCKLQALFTESLQFNIYLTTPEHIRSLPKNGLLGKNLEILLWNKVIPISNGMRTIYIDQIVHAPSGYITKQRTGDPSDIKTPLLDLLYLAQRIKDFADYRQWDELDAMIHELLEGQNSDLLDFFFSGLKEFHVQRAGKKMQQCINDHEISMKPG